MFADKNDFKKYKWGKHEERRQYLNEYKLDRGCEFCGYKKHPQALVFDHIDPDTKHPKYSSKQLTRWGPTTLQEELDKCRVLCANCHAIHTYDNKHHARRKNQKRVSGASQDRQAVIRKSESQG